MATLKMAIDALNKDSAAWSAASEDLEGSSTAAWARTISSGAFPINVPVNLSSAYSGLLTKVGDLLAAGAQESADVATELINVRNILEGSDDGAKQDIDGLWDYE